MSELAIEAVNAKERALQCPHCAVPRFLAGVRGSLDGPIEIRCPKCRTFTIFSAETGTEFPGKTIDDVSPETIHTERCEGCRTILARWVLGGTGSVRIPCVRRDCKWNHRTRIADGVAL